MFKNIFSKPQPKPQQSSAHAGPDGEQGQAIAEISDMLENMGFDTEHLLWIAKQNKEAFSTLVDNNQKIANCSVENLEQATFVEEKLQQVNQSFVIDLLQGLLSIGFQLVDGAGNFHLQHKGFAPQGWTAHHDIGAAIARLSIRLHQIVLALA